MLKRRSFLGALSAGTLALLGIVPKAASAGVVVEWEDMVRKYGCPPPLTEAHGAMIRMMMASSRGVLNRKLGHGWRLVEPPLYEFDYVPQEAVDAARREKYPFLAPGYAELRTHAKLAKV